MTKCPQCNVTIPSPQQACPQCTMSLREILESRQASAENCQDFLECAEAWLSCGDRRSGHRDCLKEASDRAETATEWAHCAEAWRRLVHAPCEADTEEAVAALSALRQACRNLDFDDGQGVHETAVAFVSIGNHLAKALLTEAFFHSRRVENMGISEESIEGLTNYASTFRSLFGDEAAVSFIEYCAGDIGDGAGEPSEIRCWWFSMWQQALEQTGLPDAVVKEQLLPRLERLSDEVPSNLVGSQFECVKTLIFCAHEWRGTFDDDERARGCLTRAESILNGIGEPDQSWVGNCIELWEELSEGWDTLDDQQREDACDDRAWQLRENQNPDG